MKAPDYIRLKGTGDNVLISFGKKRTRETNYIQTVNEYGNVELERVKNEKSTSTESEKNTSNISQPRAPKKIGIPSILKTKTSMFCNPNNVFVTDSGKIACKFLYGKPQCEEYLCCKICEYRKFHTCQNRCQATKGDKYNPKKEKKLSIWAGPKKKAENEMSAESHPEIISNLTKEEKKVNLEDWRKLMSADCKHVQGNYSAKGSNICGHVLGKPCEETKCCRFCPASESCNSCCHFVVKGSDKEVSIIKGDTFNVMEKVNGMMYSKVWKLIYGEKSKIKTREEALKLIKDLEDERIKQNKSIKKK